MLTENDFPLKADMSIATRFRKHKDVCDTTERLMKALFEVAENKNQNPWDYAIQNIKGLKEFYKEMVAKGCCLSYDYINDEIIVVKAKNR